jgi:eukaryotic-like serine/threonine-protein kinase
MAIKPRAPGTGPASERSDDHRATVLADFTLAWEQGRAPTVEDYLDRLDPADSQAAVELIYREFCLAEADGCRRDIAQYVDRFPRHKQSLERLMRLHGECPPSLLDRWMETTPALEILPEAGDEIGPYLLRRELGRGGFSRVFLAEQTNLENRLVVLKLSTRSTREPWLLARVRHAHIVEIVSHAWVDDDAFQMICMPFWGGATLATVLAARRETGKRPVSGLDLLADLDSVAAPEFPTVQAARPAREMLASLSYGQAVAWVGARLAEALDHAFSRDVAHGDVKPSNILLSADGNPLLLDFNLARDWSPASLSQSIIDPGGTVAYMPPERLLRLTVNDDLERDPSLPLSTPPRESGAHQADIYSLGMVLLEALTGRPPATVTVVGDSAAGTDSGRLRSLARAYATARSKTASDTLSEAAACARRVISPGLRAILERCLDPDPARRYRRGLELAEDLDRWRADRPLLTAPEPFWGQTVPRLLRRQRPAILAAALSLAIIVATTAVALVKSGNMLRELALHKISRLWDDPEARAYRFQRSNYPRLLEPDDSRVETAAHALKEYDVLTPDDWRRREDVRNLPQAERKDLEVWLMEQVYLYCLALADRPESPRDWSRAVKILDHVSAHGPIPAFAPLRHRLLAQLQIDTSITPSPTLAGASVARQVFWGNEYLLGVVAECDQEAALPVSSPSQDQRIGSASDKPPVIRTHENRTQRAAGRALAHYNKFLDFHANSFWGHYRAAAVSYGLGGRANFAGAAGHLEQCLKRRPNNPMLHNHLAASFMTLDRHREAQTEIELAIEEAPDLPEFYRTRARLRTTLGQTGGLAEDLHHFELLSNILPRKFWGQNLANANQFVDSSASGLGSLASPLAFADGLGGRGRERTDADIDPEELIDRADLATAIRKAGKPELAAAELGKILILDPDHIGVRMTRATQAIAARQFDEALPDIETVIDDPRLVDYLRQENLLLSRFGQSNDSSFLSVLQTVCRHYCATGRITEGKRIARRAVQLATLLDQPTGESHYNLARAHAAGDVRTVSINRAANQLFHAFVAHPLFKERYTHDPAFDAVRQRIDAILCNKPDPGDEHRRRLAATALPKGR